MKKTIFAVLAVLSISACFAGCKTNTNDYTDNTTATPPASELPNTANNRTVTRRPDNGEVTDGNGIIGDNDDLVIDRNGVAENDRNERLNNDNVVGDTVRNAGDSVNNAAHNAGDIVDNVTDNAGNIISNIADKTGDTVENVADNVGDTVQNAADNTTDSSKRNR